MFATLHTNHGDVRVTLFPQHAPKTVANFTDLASGTKEWKDPRSGAPRTEPFFDGLTFHRIIPGFMVQGGDPAGNGTGGPGYAFDDEIQQYAHGAGIEVLTPRGVVSKYFYGIEFYPRDLKFGLIEASDERIGTAIDNALLLCYHYDPATGKYGAAAIGAVRIGAVATVLAFLSFLFVSLRRERTAHRGAV